MKLTPIVFLLSTLTSSAFAELPKVDSLITKDGKQYTKVEVREKVPDGIKIIHDGGLAHIKAENLPDDILIKLGAFDPDQMAEYRRKNDEEKELAKIRANAAMVTYKINEKMWRCYNDEILVLKTSNNPPQDKINNLRKEREQVRIICEALLAAGYENRDQITQWVEFTKERRICVGMPIHFVEIAWGKPTNASKDSRGGRSWHYDKAHVTFRDDFVEYYNEFE